MSKHYSPSVKSKERLTRGVVGVVRVMVPDITILVGLDLGPSGRGGDPSGGSDIALPFRAPILLVHSTEKTGKGSRQSRSSTESFPESPSIHPQIKPTIR